MFLEPLLFSWVEYRVEDYEGDDLVIDCIYVERIPWTGGPVQWVFDSGLDAQSHWQTTDATPPEVWLTPLPRYVRVWLGDTQLSNVTWVDERTLHATVPASVKPGVHSFRVRNPSGHESNRLPLLKVGRPLYLPVVGTAR